MHGNTHAAPHTTPPHPSFTYSLPAFRAFPVRKSSIASFVTRAAASSLTNCCFAPSLAAATLYVKPARIHLASPTLTQEHSADRQHAIAKRVRNRCLIGALHALFTC